MPRPGQITATPIHVPSVLVVLDAAWPELFARCLGAAVRIGVLVHRCEVAAASTFAAERRPLAIVLSNAVYALDPDEFEALARDVHAALLKVDEEITERELEAMFSAALRERDRRDDGGSRYALIRQVEAEAPMPRTSQPPAGGPRTQAPPPSSRAMQLAGLRPSQAPPQDGPPPSVRAPLPPRPPSSARAHVAAFEAPPPSARSGAMAPVPGSVRAPQPPRSTPTLRPFATPAAPQDPPPSVRGGVPAAPPSSVRGGPIPPPSQRSATPIPGSLPPPPSVRGASLAPPRPAPGAPPISGPRSQPGSSPPAPTAAPLVKAAPTDPRSGVRYGGDALDAVFEEQELPHETRARGGSS